MQVPNISFLREFFWAGLTLLSCCLLGYTLKLFFTRYKNIFFQAIANPIFFLFIFIGLFSGIEIAELIHPSFKEFILASKKSVFVLCIFWFCISCINIYEKKFYKVKDKRTFHLLLKLSKALITIISITILMDIFGIAISGILTVAGIGGAAIGFASKDLLANFFGAIILFIDKPFTVGDNIKLSNGKEGEVEDIGWRLTKLRAPDTSCVYIANSYFSNISVENYSKRTHRKINQTIRIKYSDINKLEFVTKEVREMMHNIQEIDSNKRIDCFISSFEDSYVTCKIGAFSKIINKLEFSELSQKIMIKISKIIAKHKLEFAFHVMDVRIENK